MRTGAIFARGSCRALKWMALFAVVFALGVANTSAQVNITVDPAGTGGTLPAAQNRGRVTVAESSARVPVTVTITVPANTLPSAGYTVSLELRAPTGIAPDLVGEATAADADLAWGGVSRGTLTTSQSTSWGQLGSPQTRTLTFSLETFQDDDAEDEHYELLVTAGSAAQVTSGVQRVRMTDDETQLYVLRHHLSPTGQVNEGDTVTGIRLEATPKKTVGFPIRVNLASLNDQSDYHIGAVGLGVSQDYHVPAPAPGASSQFLDITLVTSSPDGDRIDDDITLTAYLLRGQAGASPSEGNWTADPSRPQGTLQLTVIDQHKLPAISLGGITILDANNRPQSVTSIPEGQVGTVVLMADRTPSVVPNETIRVTLSHDATSSADRSDYTISPQVVTIPATAPSGTFQVNVDADEDIGVEELKLSAVVAGLPGNPFGADTDSAALGPIPFTDRTNPKIATKPVSDIEAAVAAARTAGAGANGLWAPGETLTLMADELFSWPPATMTVVLGTITFSNPQIARASTANDELIIEAISEGMTQVSVTATVVDPAPVTTTSQTVSNAATVTFELSVDGHAITAMSQATVQAAADAAVAKAAADSANGIWEPAPNGAVAMIALSDLFDVPASVTPKYLAESSDEADVVAAVSGMNVELTPMGDGTAMITVTAVDTGGSGSAVAVDFSVTVVAQAAIRGLSQAAVDAVFDAAGADGLVAQGPSISLDMSDLFEVGPGVTPTYPAESSDMDVLGASTSGTMLMLTPGQGVAGGAATITVTAVDTASGTNDSVEYMAMVDKLPPMLTITSEPMSGSAVEEGSTITVTATLNQEAPHDKSIALQVSGSASPGEAEIMLKTGMTSASTMLAVDDDNAVMAMPDVVVVASHEAIMGGSAVLNFSVTENDVETTYDLTVSADTVEEGGEAVTITATASQAVMEDTMVELTATGGTADADDYTLDPMMISIASGETSGSTMLTATDDYDVEGMESLTLQGAIGNMIVGSVMVEIGDNDMEITYTLSAEDMNIAEGMSAELTATASSAVHMDTEVMVMRDGESTAADADFTAESIMIMAGETTGTTMVMAVEDNEPDSGAGSPEMLTLYGMVDGTKTNSVSFYLWDAAVPALPVIAQLLLAGLLGLGGYRRYRRR